MILTPELYRLNYSNSISKVKQACPEQSRRGGDEQTTKTVHFSTAITNDLPSVFCWVSQMASSSIRSERGSQHRVTDEIGLASARKIVLVSSFRACFRSCNLVFLYQVGQALIQRLHADILSGLDR